MRSTLSPSELNISATGTTNDDDRNEGDNVADWYCDSKEYSNISEEQKDRLVALVSDLCNDLGRGQQRRIETRIEVR